MRFESSVPELRDRPNRHGELRLQRLNFRSSNYARKNVERSGNKMRQKAIRELILKEQLKGIPNLHSISDIDINFDRSKFMFCGICKLLLHQLY
jgi:hypothetical protein